MTSTRFRCVVAFALLLISARAFAQTATNGAIAGAVKDSTGAVLPGVTVEASSPALIEKARTVVTDAQGNYKILELRPGAYTVAFSLAGFSTVKREGVVLTTGFTANVNADMKVGALEETVIVTGASPIVDVQNARTQKVLSEELLNELPTGKMTNGFVALTLGAVQGGQIGIDLGGSRGEASTQVSIHGSRGDDLKRMVDGMNFNMLAGAAGGQNVTFRVSSIGVQETVLEGNATAESETTGGINYVPKDGSNVLTLTGVTAYSDHNFQTTNLNDTLRGRGATTPPFVKKIWDYGVGVGGPIKKDKVWFYSANRFWGAQNAPPGAYWNKTQNTFVYTPDLSRPAYEDQWNREFSGRFTWQASSKNKLTYSQHYNKNCNCVENISSVLTPEASDSPNNHNNFMQTTWTYPATNRLLFTAGASFGFFGITIPLMDGVTTQSIALQELSTGVLYNARAPGATGYNVTHNGQGASNNFNQRASVTYVTGSHAVKVGSYTQHGDYFHDAYTLNSISYQLRLGVPVSLTQFLSPFHWDMKFNVFDLYAQDQWTLHRLTLNYGIRYDQIKGSVPVEHVRQTLYTTPFDLPATTGIPDFRDISPRVSAAYDMFGNGKTAVKVSFGRYVAAEATGTTQQVAPIFQITQQTGRTWNDLNGNFVPDCVLANLDANGECGAASNRAFGTRVPTVALADDVLNGWGNRQYNLQTAVVLQQELRPGIGLTVGYYRTDFRNLKATDNRTVVPADFDPYCVTTPSDSRLPGGGGQQLCGLYNLNPSKFGLPPNNLITQSSHYPGRHREQFNGVDVGFNARFGKGGVFNGGVAAGSQATYNCKVIDSPEAGRLNFCGSPAPAAAQPWSAGTQVKFNGVYPLPWAGIEAGAVYQNLPGVQILANLVYTNAQVASSLGRNLAGCPATGACTATVTVPIIAPQTTFEDRLNQLDLRFTKVVRVGKTRIKGNFDIYNLTNDATVLAANTTYGPAWLRPTNFHGARLFKLSAEINY